MAPLPTVTIATTDGTAREGVAGDGLSFTLTRTGDLSGALTVNTYVDGSTINTATSGQDFGAPPRTVTFQPGFSTAVLNISVIDDVVAEATEGVAAYVFPGDGYQRDPSNSIANASILDNDSGPAPLPTIVERRGSAGNDSFTNAPGEEVFLGLGATDTLVFDFAFTGVTVRAAGALTVLTRASGRDSFSGIERVVFADRIITLDDGSPLVDDLFYLAANPDVTRAGIDAENHYFAFGAREGRDPSAFFSTSGYLSANPDVRAAGINALEHYNRFGFQEGRDPSLIFDNEAYLNANPDVRAAGLNPLTHFLEYGRGEGRQSFVSSGTPADIADNGFDREYYLLANSDVGRAGVDPQGHYGRNGVSEGRNPNAFFDTTAYLNAYTDVRAAGVNPLEHYHHFGFREGRDPSTQFDTSQYLDANPDVRAAGIDPLFHYLEFGRAEGRAAFDDGTLLT